ncbi:MAG TPA: hypothetical protein VKZ18_19030 [Polyangia bacterium]|nr:hypothetical protein [Polyangia bacterium]
MVAKRVARIFGLLCLATGAVGCAQPDEPGGAAVGVAAITENGLTANGLTANGLTANGLTANGLTANGLTANGLTANGLTANGLTANGLTANGLSDPSTYKLLDYLVSCALLPQQSITLAAGGSTYTFTGQLGLAPQWGLDHGSCDGSCQRWVSACLLARIDAAGIDREISVRGPSVTLWPTPSEISTYTQKEATYFGNLFIPGQPRFLCLAPGQKQDPRVCGDSLANCPMTVVGACAQDCLVKGGAFGDSFCSDAGRLGAGQTYFESVTVFLPK